MVSSSVLLLISLVFFSAHYFDVSEAQNLPPLARGLSMSFYEQSCPKLESIIRKQLQKEFKKDIGQAAGLLRIHFHDCFVQVQFFSKFFSRNSFPIPTYKPLFYYYF